MSWHIPAKVAVLVTLSVASWFCTSSLIAQSRPKGRAQANRIQFQQGAMKVQKANRPAVQQNLVVGEDLCSFEFLDMSATTAAGNVTVHGSMKIWETRPGVTYTWKARVKDATTNAVVLENTYVAQTFSVPLGVFSSPTFDDTFAILPGSYRSELELIENSTPSEMLVAGFADFSIP